MEANATTKLEECNHEFHAQCIVKWFRSKHTTCPQCRGKPNTHLSKPCAKARFQELKRQVRRKSAPKLLKRHFAQLKKLKDNAKKRKSEWNAMRKEVKKLRQNPQIKEYLKKVNACRPYKWWTLDRKVRQKQYLIGATDYGTGLGNIAHNTIVSSEMVFEDGSRMIVDHTNAP